MSYAAGPPLSCCADIRLGLPCREARIVMPRIALPAGSGDEGDRLLFSAASSLDQACSILHSLVAVWLVSGY